MSRILNLTTMAPGIVATILDETSPDQVTLMDRASGTALLWEYLRRAVKWKLEFEEQWNSESI